MKPIRSLTILIALLALTLLPAHAQTWTGTWSTSPMAGSISTAFNNMTLRQIVHTSISGTAARVQISNAFGTVPLTISDCHIAQASSPSSTATVAGTDHAVTFGGSSSVTIAAGGKAVSDSVAMSIGAQSDIAISYYFPTASMTSNVTYHQFALATSWWASGDVSANSSFSPIGQSSSTYWLANLDVVNANAAGAVVCLGASITDGYASTFGANHRWPNDLAGRINSAGMTVEVLNQGISGNTLLANGSGPTAQVRFQRDVLSQPNVKWVIFSDDPINDLTSNNPPPSASSLESAISSLISQAHQAGLKFYMSTLTPYSKDSGWTQAQETIREQVISWTTSGASGADGVVDQNVAIQDPNNPTAILASYDSGDGLHPNDAGLQAIANAVNLNFFGASTESPYGGTPWSIPGTLQAENYDFGGEGVAYHDSDTVNSGGQYRTDGVDIETTSDTGGGYDVGYTNNGEWLRYTVNVSTAGTYTVGIRVASNTAVGSTAGQLHIQTPSGTNLSGAVNVPGTGGWQTWSTVNATVTLPAGQQVLEVYEDTGGYNLNYLTFTAASSGEAPYLGTPWAIPGTVQSENYDTGGEGVAYHDADAANQGGQYRTSDGVDVETCSDTGGGYDVGWNAVGEWQKYTVNVSTAGTYTVTFRVSNGTTANGSFHLQNASGTNLTGTVTVTPTGGWQTWTNVAANVTLPAGQQILTLWDDGSNYNINYMTFASQGGGTAPSAPTGLTASAGNSQVSLTWTGSSGATSYNVYRGTSSGGESTTPIATGLASTTYTNTGLTNGTTYYYKVAAVNSSGTSGQSNEASATPRAALTAVDQINCGSPSAVSPFVADEFFSAGNEFSSTNTINLNGQSNAAPAAVYQTVRWNSSFNYTIPNLTANASYTVRLHFCELTWTAAGQRKFNVAINGSTVLSAFDIFQAAGGQNKALVETFTTTANSSGQIVVAFTQGGADNPEVAGLEVLH